MESPRLQVISDDNFEDGPLELYESDTSSDITEGWDDEFSFRFTLARFVNESKLPATLYKMRAKREKIFGRIQRKEKKFYEKQFRQQFIDALENEKIEIIHYFEDNHFDVAVSALWKIIERKKLLTTFLFFSKNTELAKLALMIYPCVVIRNTECHGCNLKTSKKQLSRTKTAPANSPKAYSRTYAQWEKTIKEKRIVIKLLKQAIKENNPHIIKEVEVNHPKILYTRLSHLITNARLVFTFVTHEGKSYTQDFTAQNKKSLQTILDAKINPNLVSPYGTSILYEACDEHRMSFAKILCETPGINMNQQTPGGTTPLLQFISHCSRIFEKRGQLDFSSSCYSKEEIEKTVQKETRFVAYLLDKGADANLADKNGTTPLMLASSLSCFTIVKLLLQRGANPYTKDAFGKNALDHYEKCTSSRTLGSNFFYTIIPGAEYDSRIQEILVEAMR